MNLNPGVRLGPYEVIAALGAGGMLHRDLKPENVFITRDGLVRILDFGVAKITTVLDEARTVAWGTTPGTVLGTVGYMSPEQARGHHVDHRTDLFAFGTILYEMLSGKRAFHCESSADAAIDRIIRHCLKKNPEERFQSARDFAFDLQTISGISGSSPAIALRASGQTTRWIAFAAATIIGLLLGIASTAVFRRGGTAAAAPRTLTELTFQGGVERHPSLSPAGKTFLVVSEASGNADIHLQRVDGRNAIRGGIFVMGATGESVRRIADFGYSPFAAHASDPDKTIVAVTSDPPLDWKLMTESRAK